MKSFLLLLVCMSIGIFGFSQSAPCAVTNFINSGSVQVILYASPPNACDVTCQVGPICVYPGQTVNVPPCGPGFWEWSLVRVLPTTDDCSTYCSPLGMTVASPVGCAAPTDTNFHCHAGTTYTADFVSGGLNTLWIY